MIRFKKRPLLVQGTIGWCFENVSGEPMILISDDLYPDEENKTLWHEIMHAIGISEEEQAEELAAKLADAVDLTQLIKYETE